MYLSATEILICHQKLSLRGLLPSVLHKIRYMKSRIKLIVALSPTNATKKKDLNAWRIFPIVSDMAIIIHMCISPGYTFLLVPNSRSCTCIKINLKRQDRVFGGRSQSSDNVTTV